MHSRSVALKGRQHAALFVKGQAVCWPIPMSRHRMSSSRWQAGAGHVKYWLGAGRGGFGLSGSECLAPTFYCQVYTTPEADVDSERRLTVKTSEVPIKPPFFATVKSNNYLPNVLTVMDAEADGYDQVTTLMCCLARLGHHCCISCKQHLLFTSSGSLQ